LNFGQEIAEGLGCPKGGLKITALSRFEFVGVIIKPAGIIVALVAVVGPGNVETAVPIQADRLGLKVEGHRYGVKSFFANNRMAGGGAVVPQPEVVKTAGSAVLPGNAYIVNIMRNITYLHVETS
jgi:hypothetical protein